MKKHSLIYLGLLVCIINLNAQQLAFPGADGYGKYVTGGRGGAVYEVTNLNDDGLPGSLRYAINQSGPRTIVFRISGTIALTSTLKITNGDVTIAGQTAPGDGICLKNYAMGIDANNVIIRYMRFRLGENWGSDALSGNSPKASAGSGSLPRKNVIIDHCSVSYGADETLSMYDIENLTIQWCIISESMNRDGHGFGGIMGGWGASLHHSLFAHHKNRSPRFCGARYQFNLDRELVDMRYNIIYNAGKSYGGEGGHHNVINNYYKRLTGEFCNPSQPNPSETDNEFVGCIYDSIKSYWYVDGNYVYNNPTVNADNWNGGVKFNYPALNIRIYDPLPSEYSGAEETAEEAYLNVLSGAGATLPKRDAVDTRVVADVINNSGSVPNTLADIPGLAYPVLNSIAASEDNDHDGMPNDWETANGLNPDLASDRNTYAPDGYTMLEKYLNSIEFTNKVEGVECKSTSNRFVKIRWADTFLGEDGFIIERATPGNGFTKTDSLAANTSSYIDSSASVENEYIYRIKAFNASDESPYSDEVLYVPTYFNLTTSVNGQGTVDPGSGSYMENTVITFTANPEEGWGFSYWSGGDLGGTNNPDSLVITSDVSVTANFYEIVNIDERFNSANTIYPNPFLDEVNFDINMPSRMNLEIIIYDMSGAVVDIVTNQIYDPGLHKITWTIEEGKRSMIQAGIFFCEIRTGTSIQVKKLSLLK